jgi:ATPase subunit of ABC transporter with duplicated ATPase domains
MCAADAGAHESKGPRARRQMGFSTQKPPTPRCKELSGGEKARLLLGLAAFHAPTC